MRSCSRFACTTRTRSIFCSCFCFNSAAFAALVSLTRTATDFVLLFTFKSVGLFGFFALRAVRPACFASATSPVINCKRPSSNRLGALTMYTVASRLLAVGERSCGVKIPSATNSHNPRLTCRVSRSSAVAMERMPLRYSQRSQVDHAHA